ncbi:MAG: ABC transporter permease [Planctomycetes bacterium]|nr:ABC transporter permease [Planctomycetota bacterium]
MSSTVSFIIACVLLETLQFLAALPWLLAIDLRARTRWRQPASWGKAALVLLGIGIGSGLILDANSGTALLRGLGRLYMSVLHLQLAADFLVLCFFLLLKFWPKGGAVALSAFREGVRQPMFWLLAVAALFFMLISPVVPYFTFGEDLKMVIELCYAFTMMAPALFGVVAASMSVSEEIEGRTAITVMSKPISRRQFLLGKFLGILSAALLMTFILGWVLIWISVFGRGYVRLPAQPEFPDPAWVVDAAQTWFPESSLADLALGMGLWFDDVQMSTPGLVIGFCQVMVLLAIAVALATRLPMVVNFPICMLVYFLGHLTPILTEVSRNNRLVYFVAQLFDNLLPGLDLFDVGTAVVRETPLPLGEYALYTLNVSVYAVIYASIALLFGLILFEDRDLA